MNKKIKRSFYLIGSLTLVASPVIAVVSCSADLTDKDHQSDNLIIRTLEATITKDGIEGFSALGAFLLVSKEELQKAVNDLNVKNAKINPDLLEGLQEGEEDSDVEITPWETLSFLLVRRLIEPKQTDVDDLKKLIQTVFINNYEELRSIVLIRPDQEPTFAQNSFFAKLFSIIENPINDLLLTLQSLGPQIFSEQSLEVDAQDASLTSLELLEKHIPSLHLDVLGQKVNKALESLLDIFDPNKDVELTKEVNEFLESIIHYIDPTISEPDFVRDLFAGIGEVINVFVNPNDKFINELLPSVLESFGLDLTDFRSSFTGDDWKKAITLIFKQLWPSILGVTTPINNIALDQISSPFITHYELVLKDLNDRKKHPNLTDELPNQRLLHQDYTLENTFKILSTHYDDLIKIFTSLVPDSYFDESIETGTQE